jgi:hypothetical protein
VHPPLHEMLAGPHAAGLAALRAADVAFSTRPQHLPTLRAAPAVEAALRADPVALADWQRRTGRPFPMRADATLPGCAWSLDE